MDVHLLVQQLAQQLIKKKSRVATAESCTGGGIAEAMTQLAGSSDWFECGWITYSNAAKQKCLQINPELILLHGAVSEVVVLAMAHNALALADVQYSVAVSGIAGPSGGTEQKPVGTVWIGWAALSDNKKVEAHAQCFRFSGNRQSVREQTIEQALLGLINLSEK